MSDPTSARMLADWRDRLGKPSRLGCSLVSHRDLGFCSACLPEGGRAVELSAWRLLAMAERGIPDQPFATVGQPSTAPQNHSDSTLRRVPAGVRRTT